MKAIYEKPQFVIEQFGLTQTISAGCSVEELSNGLFGKPNLAYKSTCGWDTGSGEIVFVVGTVCSNEGFVALPEDVALGQICYNNPNGALTVFRS